MSERIRGSYDDALYKSTYTYYSIKHWLDGYWSEVRMADMCISRKVRPHPMRCVKVPCGARGTATQRVQGEAYRQERSVILSEGDVGGRDKGDQRCG